MNSIDNLFVRFNNDYHPSTIIQLPDEATENAPTDSEQCSECVYTENNNLRISSKKPLVDLYQKVKSCWNRFENFLKECLNHAFEIFKIFKLYKWIKVDGSLFKGPVLGFDFSRTSIENLHQHVTVVCNGESADSVPCRSCGELNNFTHNVTHVAHTNTIAVH